MMNSIQPHNNQALLQATAILDYRAPSIQKLVAERGWARLESKEKAAQSIYNFCKDEILFGYNSEADNISASSVLAEGLGHCNTKTNLLMALLRAVEIPCQLHAFTIHKRLQKGALTPFVYFMSPKEIIHTWTEVWINGKWVALEGMILDSKYLHSIQHQFKECAHHKHPFLGYAVASKSLNEPTVEWTGSSTFIQREGIARELGTYPTPDAFYAEHQTNLKGIKGWLYRKYFYKQLNKNISNIRNGQMPNANVTQQCGL